LSAGQTKVVFEEVKTYCIALHFFIFVRKILTNCVTDFGKQKKTIIFEFLLTTFLGSWGSIKNLLGPSI